MTGELPNTIHTQSLYGLKPMYRKACAQTNTSSPLPPTGTGPAGQTRENTPYSIQKLTFTVKSELLALSFVRDMRACQDQADCPDRARAVEPPTQMLQSLAKVPESPRLLLVRVNETPERESPKAQSLEQNHWGTLIGTHTHRLDDSRHGNGNWIHDANQGIT